MGRRRTGKCQSWPRWLRLGGKWRSEPLVARGPSQVRAGWRTRNASVNHSSPMSVHLGVMSARVHGMRVEDCEMANGWVFPLVAGASVPSPITPARVGCPARGGAKRKGDTPRLQPVRQPAIRSRALLGILCLLRGASATRALALRRIAALARVRAEVLPARLPAACARLRRGPGQSPRGRPARRRAQCAGATLVASCKLRERGVSSSDRAWQKVSLSSRRTLTQNCEAQRAGLPQPPGAQVRGAPWAAPGRPRISRLAGAGQRGPRLRRPSSQQRERRPHVALTQHQAAPSLAPSAPPPLPPAPTAVRAPRGSCAGGQAPVPADPRCH